MCEMLKKKKIGQLWKISAISDIIDERFYIIVGKPKRTLDKRWTICWIDFNGKATIENWTHNDMEEDTFISEANSQP